MLFWLSLPLEYNYTTLETFYYSLYFLLRFSSNCCLWNQKSHKANCVFHPPWCFLPCRAIWPRKSQALGLGLLWLACAFSRGSRDLRGVILQEQHCSLWKPTQQILSGSYTMLIKLYHYYFGIHQPLLNKPRAQAKHKTQTQIHIHICTHTCSHPHTDTHTHVLTLWHTHRHAQMYPHV